MKGYITKRPLISLAALSILCGIIWRCEVEYHGWTGLIWIGYYHIAMPISFVLFLFWANQFFKLNSPKRILMNTFAIILALAIYVSIRTSVYYVYTGGPKGLFLYLSNSEFMLKLKKYQALITIPLSPIAVFALLKVFKLKPSIKQLLLSELMLIISLPLSMFLLYVVDHEGGYDELHAIKSGFLIPFVIFTFGLLFVKLKRG